MNTRLLSHARRSRELLWLAHVRRGISNFTAGGRWSAQLPAPVQRNLRWFWSDGAFAIGADSISSAYLALFALALGASSLQIGLLSALGSLSGALMLLPGALAVERLGHRQRISLGAGFGMRMIFLLMALTPMVLQNQPAVWLLLLLATLSQGFGNFGFPAWVSLTADIVPSKFRGQYFGSRNIATTLVSMVAAYAAGLIITRLGNPFGYQAAFLLAFLFGMGSSISFSQIRDPNPAPAPIARKPASESLGRRVFRHPVFLAFCASSAVWNLSLNVAAPFFNVYLVEGLKATATQVGLLTAVTSISGLPALRIMGPLADRWGPRRVVVLTTLLIPILPFVWIFITQPWHVLFINLASGVLWSGYNLASFNLLLEATPDAERPRFSALFQIVMLVSLALGGLLGGWITGVFGFKTVFAVSGIGRLAAALMFAFLVK